MTDKLNDFKLTPILIRRDNDSTLVGNDMYKGFSKDLAVAMASRLRAKYRIRTEQSFGERNKDTNQWDGLIGELVNRRADMAICDLTITVRLVFLI